jgi:hypothetical protein
LRLGDRGHLSGQRTADQKVVEGKTMSIPYAPLWAYLYPAIFMGMVSAIMLVTLWWTDDSRPGAARRRLKHYKYLKLLDDYRTGQDYSRPFSRYIRLKTR